MECEFSQIEPGERLKNVHFTEDSLAVDLIDGRTIVVPLVWYPRLLDATEAQRQNWLVSAAGYGLHWPDIDERFLPSWRGTSSTCGLIRSSEEEAIKYTKV